MQEFPHHSQYYLTILRDDILRYPNLDNYSSCEGDPVWRIQSLLFPHQFADAEIWDRVDARSAPNPTFRGLPPKYASPSRPFLERPEEAVLCR